MRHLVGPLNNEGVVRLQRSPAAHGALEGAFAAAWWAKPKWVESRSLKSVGASATSDRDDDEAFARKLKTEIEGDIDVAGLDLAGCLTHLGLIDEYRLYFRPLVHGLGEPYFVRLATAPPRRRSGWRGHG